MLEYDRMDIAEGIDITKTSASHQKSVISVTIGNLKILVLSKNHIFTMAVMM